MIERLSASFLKHQIDRITASGGNLDEAMSCARRYLELERRSKLPNRRGATPRGGAAVQLTLVKPAS